MVEPLYARGHPRSDEEPLGEEVVHHLRWFLGGRFRLMHALLPDLLQVPTRTEVRVLRARFEKALQHARRVLVARGIVTVLLALGAVTAVAATIVEAVRLPTEAEAPVEAATGALSTLAAVAGSATVLLLALRLAFDRYLALVETSVTFLGMRIAAGRAAGA